MTASEGQPGRPLVVVVFDAITAQRTAAVLGRLAAEAAPAVVLEEDAWRTLGPALAGGGPARTIVALIPLSALQGFVRRAGTAASLACIEPSLFLLADLLGEVHMLGPPAVRRCMAAYAQLADTGIAARLSMEAVFLRPSETLRLQNLPAGPVDIAADPDGYRAATAALMEAVGRDRGSFFALGTRYAVSQTGLGRVVLGRGWSHAEASFAWSDSLAATLTLMVPEATGPLRVIFRGHVIDERIAITTLVRGVRMATTTTGPLRTVDIDVPLTFEPTPGGAEVEVRFAFNTVCIPARLGWSTDQRSLAFALASIEFYVDGGWRPPSLDPDGVARLALEAPVIRRGLAGRGRAAPPDHDPPLALLRRLLDRRPGRICLVLIEESAIDEPRWAETVQALAAEILVLAATGGARLLFASAPGEVLHIEGGLDPVLALFGQRGIKPDLLFWCSGATPLAFDALWDRLLVEGGRPAVLIRAQDFEEFRWILGSRQWHDFMMSTVGDMIVFDPAERMAEL